MAKEAFLINPPRRRRRRHNPFGGGELIIAGANPRRRRRRYRLNDPDPGRRRRRRRHNPRRRAVIRHRPVLLQVSPTLWSRGPRSRSKRAGISINPRRRHRIGYRRRRYRRNPALRVSGFDFIRNLPLIATGAISATAQVAVPRYFKLDESSPMVQYGARAGVIAGGGYLLGRFAGTAYAYSWMLAGSAVLLADILKKYVFAEVFPGLVSGIGAYPMLSAYPSGGSTYALESDYSSVSNPYE